MIGSADLFLHTARSVIDGSGQRVNASDRLYLTQQLPSLIVWGDRDRMIPVEDALPEEIAAMRRADEEYARGECVRLDDLQHELGLNTR